MEAYVWQALDSRREQATRAIVRSTCEVCDGEAAATSPEVVYFCRQLSYEVGHTEEAWYPHSLVSPRMLSALSMARSRPLFTTIHGATSCTASCVC